MRPRTGANGWEVMSRDRSLFSDKPLKEAAQLMHERSVHRLPVLDAQGQVIGIPVVILFGLWRRVKNRPALIADT